MEKMPDGSAIFRSLNTEQKVATAYAQQKQKRLEELFARIEQQFEEKDSGSKLITLIVKNEATIILVRSRIDFISSKLLQN